MDDDLLRRFRGRCSLGSAIGSVTEAEMLAMQSALDVAQDEESRLRPRATSRVRLVIDAMATVLTNHDTWQARWWYVFDIQE